MKQLLLILFLGCTIFVKAQDRIKFEYDLAGNQIQRQLCINCSSSKISKKSSNEVSALDEAELQKFSKEDTFSYYPNPVMEELYVQWSNSEINKISRIQVYDFSGRLLKQFSDLGNQNNQKISFQSYPSGSYLVILVYNQGTQQTIKIIKK